MSDYISDLVLALTKKTDIEILDILSASFKSSIELESLFSLDIQIRRPQFLTSHASYQRQTVENLNRVQRATGFCPDSATW